MIFKGTLIVVKDCKKALKFYGEKSKNRRGQFEHCPRRCDMF